MAAVEDLSPSVTTNSHVTESKQGDETSEETLEAIKVRVSHYNPSLGGVNCARFVNGECLSKMSNGERWQDYWGNNDTIACPSQLEFGTKIKLNNVTYTCRDRGGAIVYENGYYWIDILTDKPPFPFGMILDAYIVKSE